MHGSCGGLPQTQRHSRIPIHRRLVSRLSIQAQGLQRYQVHPTPPQRLRTHSKSQEITPFSIQGGTLHWCQDRCTEGAHLSSTSTNTQDSHRHPEVSPRSFSIGETCPTSSRADVLHDFRGLPRSSKTQVLTDMAVNPFQSSPGSSREEAAGIKGVSTTAPVVGFPPTSAGGSSIPPSTAHGSDYHGCEPHGLGSALRPPSCPRSMVSSGKVVSYQSPRDSSSLQSNESLFSPSTRPWCSSSHRQHHGHVLYQQARGHSLSISAVSHGHSLGMVLPEPHIPSSSSSIHGGQFSCRPAQSSSRPDARMGAGHVGVQPTLSTLGQTSDRPFCLASECEMSSLRIQSGVRPQLTGRRLHAILEAGPALRLPSIPANTEDLGSTPSSVSRSHTCDTLLASAALVSDVSGHGSGLSATSQLPSSHHTGCGNGVPSRSPHSPPHSVEDLPQIKEILDQSRKASTSTLYAYKWRSFIKFTDSKGLSPVPASLSTVLQFLRYLFDLKLSVATLKVYLSAIVSFQPRESPSSRLFSHPTVKAFLKGLSHIRPPFKPLVPQWSLNLVLRALMCPPFEPLATCSLKLLSLKVLFLVAITSARRASELAALRADQPFLQFFNDKVILHTDVSFLPKVVSEFHLNQPLVLPTFFSQPTNETERMLHSLDVRRALSFYVARTKEFRLSPKLFLCYFGHKKGLPASSSSISRWLVSAIALAYELQHKPPPEGLRAHSTRAVASSTALLRGVDLPDICRTATWSSVSTFISHYRLDMRARKETRFGRAVLASALQ
ncbi:uncharacterized protein LOC144589350 [Pogona vitticeps]